MASHVRYLDANVMIGPGDFTGPEHPVTVEALLAAMDHFGIHEALVRDSAGEIGDVAKANERIVDLVADQPRLYAVWQVLPPHSRELAPPREMVEQMREAGVAAAWLPYGAFGIPLEDWSLDALLAPLAEARVPLFVTPVDRRTGEGVDQTDWPGVVRVCRAFPDLPVIVTEGRIYKDQRAMLAALEACPNLRMELSPMWNAYIFDFVVELYGAERVVFGTNLPYRTPGAAKGTLDFSSLMPEQHARVAGENLWEMIGWNDRVRSSADAVRFPEPDDALHAAVRDARDLTGETFYDSHGHCGYRSQRHLFRDDPDRLLGEMDRCGVQACCIFAFLCFGDTRTANEATFELVGRFPDRFVGFTWINPNHGEAACLEQLEIGLANGMRGIKMLTPIHKYPADGPVVDLACRFAHERGLFILNHGWGDVETLRRWLTDYPGACYITGHSDGRFAELTQAFDNLFICSCPFHTWQRTEQYVRRYGADRILFGSDLLDLPIAWGLGPILYAKVSEEEKRLMAGENLRKLLERYGRI